MQALAVQQIRGKASANLYSLIGTAGANGLDLSPWLRHILERILLAQTADDFNALLPWNLKTRTCPPKVKRAD